MMKLYQFEFLLFLLLIIVNPTLSFPNPTLIAEKYLKTLESYAKAVTSPGVDILKDKGVKNIDEWRMEFKKKEMLNKFILSRQSQLPKEVKDNTTDSEERGISQLPKDIEGLYRIKQYLYDFGYLEQSGPFNNTADQETLLAFQTYGQHFNIQATDQIIAHMALPRCGVPDMNFNYSFTNDISFPKGNQWFPKGTKNLTYGFAPENEIPLNMTNVFRKALTQWSQTTSVLNFTETKSYDHADIKIAFYNMTNDDGIYDVVVGDTLIKLDSTNVKSGLIRLDATKYWALPTEDGEFDLETAAMHQIGHLLGLEHSSDNKSIMYPTILPSQQRKVQITNSDNLAIQKLYSTKANANSEDST